MPSRKRSSSDVESDSDGEYLVAYSEPKDIDTTNSQKKAKRKLLPNVNTLPSHGFSTDVMSILKDNTEHLKRLQIENSIKVFKTTLNRYVEFITTEGREPARHKKTNKRTEKQKLENSLHRWIQSLRAFVNKGYKGTDGSLYSFWNEECSNLLIKHKINICELGSGGVVRFQGLDNYANDMLPASLKSYNLNNTVNKKLLEFGALLKKRQLAFVILDKPVLVDEDGPYMWSNNPQNYISKLRRALRKLKKCNLMLQDKNTKERVDEVEIEWVSEYIYGSDIHSEIIESNRRHANDNDNEDFNSNADADAEFNSTANADADDNDDEESYFNSNANADADFNSDFNSNANADAEFDSNAGEDDVIFITKYNIRLKVGSTLEQLFVDENDGETKLYKGTITAIGESKGVETIQIEFIDEKVVISVPNLIKEINNGNIPLSKISYGEDTIEDEEAEEADEDSIDDSNDSNDGDDYADSNYGDDINNSTDCNGTDGNSGNDDEDENEDEDEDEDDDDHDDDGDDDEEYYIEGIKVPNNFAQMNTCPNENCNGTVSKSLAKKRMPNRVSARLPGPDRRLCVTCNKCKGKWFACHFDCGYVSSARISSHEQGAYRKPTNKIYFPCPNNPNREAILKELRKMQKNKDEPITTEPNTSEAQESDEESSVHESNVQEPEEYYIEGIKVPNNFAQINTCPDYSCTGTVSKSLSKKRIDRHVKARLPGPNRRLCVTCNKCKGKWFACHFDCGHLIKQH